MAPSRERGGCRPATSNPTRINGQGTRIRIRTGVLKGVRPLHGVTGAKRRRDLENGGTIRVSQMMEMTGQDSC